MVINCLRGHEQNAAASRTETYQSLFKKVIELCENDYQDISKCRLDKAYDDQENAAAIAA